MTGEAIPRHLPRGTRNPAKAVNPPAAFDERCGSRSSSEELRTLANKKMREFRPQKGECIPRFYLGGRGPPQAVVPHPQRPMDAAEPAAPSREQRKLPHKFCESFALQEGHHTEEIPACLPGYVKRRFPPGGDASRHRLEAPHPPASCAGAMGGFHAPMGPRPACPYMMF